VKTDTVLLIMSHAARDSRSSVALRKADKFAAENFGGRRVQAKQAILHELNAQLKLRSERLKSQNIATGGTGPTLSCQNEHSPSRLRCSLNSFHCILCLVFLNSFIHSVIMYSLIECKYLKIARSSSSEKEYHAWKKSARGLVISRTGLDTDWTALRPVKSWTRQLADWSTRG